jgi:hypothetical protein
MFQTNKSVVIFLEEDKSYECHILSKKVFMSQIEKYLYNNLLMGSKIHSFTLDHSNTYNLFNRDISYLKNILEIIINKYGNINDILKNIPTCKIYREEDLKKIYNMGCVPSMYKLFDVKFGSGHKYYTKMTSASNTLISILSICALYDLQFHINIELKNYVYKSVRISFEDI